MCLATYNHGLINFMEPATAIANLAFTRDFENTIETVTEATLAKINDLRNKIRDKFRENHKYLDSPYTQKPYELELTHLQARQKVNQENSEKTSDRYIAFIINTRERLKIIIYDI